MLINFIKNTPINLEMLPMGAGSNILIRDKGYDGIIIHFFIMIYYRFINQLYDINIHNEN